MLARNDTIIKWLLYTAAAALCLFVQTALLQRVTIWGVIPFIYPLAAVIPATYEDIVPGTAFALAAGVVCDLLLPEAFPCLYTLIFPIAGLAAGLLSRSVLPAGIFCSLAAGFSAFLLTDLFRCVLLALSGHAAWGAGLSVMLREFLVTLPSIFPVTALFSAVHRKVHAND